VNEPVYIRVGDPASPQSASGSIAEAWLSVIDPAIDSSDTLPTIRYVINQSIEINVWQEKLEQLSSLSQGWNGYDAPPPSNGAINTAKGFLTHLLGGDKGPSRLAPSAVGGVGITHKNNNRRVYVEFFNDGGACVLFSDNETVPESIRVTPGYMEFRELVEQIRAYLDA
jgi:hypothetical protein